MCAAVFDEVCEGLCFCVKLCVQLFQRRDQAVVDFFYGCNVHDGGECVVGALAHIAVIVGVDWVFAAACAREGEVGAARYDFVRVHVGLCARPSLPYGERELVGQCAVNDFTSGVNDGVGGFFVH